MPEWLFDNFLFSPWPGRWLSSSYWRQFCIGLSIALSLGASGLFMLEVRARRLGYPISKRLSRSVCITITVLAFLVYYDFFNPNTRYHAYYHRHELYHYYLGSKYFDEVGYKRLYGCTAIAEVEAGRGAQIARLDMRDLSAQNLIVPIKETYVFSDPEHCKRHFTPERWQAFKTDVLWFESVSRGDYWNRMKIDHGYNPPPVWTMTGKLVTSFAPAGDHFFKLLALLDIGLQLSALLLIGWAFGLKIMTVAAVFWGCNGAASSYWTGGALLRQDWFFLFVASLCLARKRWFALAGAALSWSALLRVFPIIFFAGAGLLIGFDLLRRRRLRADHRHFILGSVLSACLLVAASSAVSGVTAYRDFVAHISLHKSTPLTNNMGLEMMLVHDWDGRMVFTIDQRLDDSMQVWKQGHAARVRARRPLLAALNVVVLAWIAWVLSKIRRLWVGIALGVPLVMSALSVTCYYYAFFIAFAVVVRLSRALGPAYLALAGASQILLARFYWYDDRYVAQSLLFYAFASSSLYALSRPVPLRQLWARLVRLRTHEKGARSP